MEVFFQRPLIVPDVEQERSVCPEVLCMLERAQVLESDGPDIYCVILSRSLNFSEPFLELSINTNCTRLI